MRRWALLLFVVLVAVAGHAEERVRGRGRPATPPPAGGDAVLREDSGYVLREDGDKILRE